MNSPKKTKKKVTKKYYFTKEHEDAVVKYCKTNCVRIRTDLYVKYLEPAFDEMVDKIVFTYKFTSLPNIDYLRDECKVWLMTILDKYDPDKGYKAFSYFSVITKNWFIHKVKKQQKRNKTWDVTKMRANDQKVHQAIIILFESKDDIEIFNKKAIYLYLREITGLNTKQVVSSLNKFRVLYRGFKKEWENGDL